MVRSLYTGWTGMLNEQKRLDVMTNNLANAATVGYKKEFVTSQSFDEQLAIKIRDRSEGWRENVIGHVNLGTKLGEIHTDYEQGSLRETDATYDLAIDGAGFFRVSVTDGAGAEHTMYTRSGQFHITQDGYVVDANGNHLMSENGRLQIPTDTANVIFYPDGTIFADGAVVDRLPLYDFDDYDYLKKMGHTMVEPVDGAQPNEIASAVRQGYLEQSNVNIVYEMVTMIAITRAFEAGQKVVQTTDKSLEQADSIGRVGG